MRRAIGFECQVVRAHDFRLIGKRGIDLSPTGMLVVGDVPTLTGEPVIVTFRLPRIRIWFDALAAVARVVHGRRPRDRAGLCFGLEFDPLAPNVVRYLRSELHGLPPPLPMREPRIDYAGTVHLAALS
ncbi:MAG TPA: PilZ domain-containing protein [Polyangiaceae bacterium]|nr:PilZ domain-containing protein [Polyangiaceae bacterium]